MSQIRTDSIVPSGGLPAGATAGGAIQVVQAVKTAAETITQAGGGEQAISGLTVSITPRSTSSKVLIYYSVNVGGRNSDYAGKYLKLYRGATAIHLGDSAGSRIRCTSNVSSNEYGAMSYVATVVDSPSTTSATSYSIKLVAQDGVSFNINANNYQEDSDSVYKGRTASSIIVMEVSG
jgi:hypothetical protein